MQNETVDSILKNALKTLGVPFQRLLYEGEAETFIVFQLVLGMEVNFSDDDTEQTEWIYQVHIYSKKDYTSLLRRTKKALKEAGFYNIIVNPEIYERDTGYYHVPLEINYLEE